MSLKNPKVFISGPIDSNAFEKSAEKFKMAEELLIGRGYNPVNPTQLPKVFPGEDLNNRKFWLSLCLSILGGCDKIFFLEGSEKSKGSLLERHVAKELGIEEIL